MKIYNLSPGPAILPEAVMKEAQAEFLNYEDSGMSILEVSHRSQIFDRVIKKAEADFRSLLDIPETYEVLFLQGGASTQFAMVPLNLMQKGKADYLDTGSWSAKAMSEARKYGEVRMVASSAKSNYTYIPETTEKDFDRQADYLHLTPNNTIFGTRISTLPGIDGVARVADMSSCLLSERFDVRDYGLIYAGAQKNMGPAGLTLVMIRKDLIGHAMKICPKMLNYSTHAEKNSLFNTPPTFSIYLSGKVFEWTLKEGGVEELEKRNIDKAQMLYDFLDNSDFYQANIESPHRSRMNVCFHGPDEEKDSRLVAFAEKRGCMFLKGHRSVGGLRASLYNAMPKEGVEQLIQVLEEFARSE